VITFDSKARRRSVTRRRFTIDDDGKVMEVPLRTPLPKRYPERRLVGGGPFAPGAPGWRPDLTADKARTVRGVFTASAELEAAESPPEPAAVAAPEPARRGPKKGDSSYGESDLALCPVIKELMRTERLRSSWGLQTARR
jgi:hypothetical protein